MTLSIDPQAQKQTLEICDLGPGDASSLAQFFAENARPEVIRHFHPFALDAESAGRLCGLVGRDRYWVAQEAATIVGLAMLRGWDQGYEVPSFGVVVDHRRHGKGLGRRLTVHAIAAARAAGSPRVRLTVYRSNDRAHGLYHSLGFREVSRARSDRFPDDENITMMLELGSGTEETQ